MNKSKEELKEFYAHLDVDDMIYILQCWVVDNATDTLQSDSDDIDDNTLHGTIASEIDDLIEFFADRLYDDESFDKMEKKIKKRMSIEDE